MLGNVPHPSPVSVRVHSLAASLFTGLILKNKAIQHSAFPRLTTTPTGLQNNACKSQLNQLWDAQRQGRRIDEDSEGLGRHQHLQLQRTWNTAQLLAISTQTSRWRPVTQYIASSLQQKLQGVLKGKKGSEIPLIDLSDLTSLFLKRKNNVTLGLSDYLSEQPPKFFIVLPISQKKRKKVKSTSFRRCSYKFYALASFLIDSIPYKSHKN